MTLERLERWSGNPIRHLRLPPEESKEPGKGGKKRGHRVNPRGTEAGDSTKDPGAKVAATPVDVLEIITHFLHGDELVAAALPGLRPDLAEPLLPGLSKANVRQFDPTRDTLEELERLAGQGKAVLLGFGNPSLPWVINEHGGLELKTCTAELMARKLGLLEDPQEKQIWGSLLRDMHEVDTHGATSGITDLPHCVRVWELHRDHGVPIDQIMQEVMRDLQMLLREEALMAQTTGKHEEIQMGRFNVWCLPPLNPNNPIDHKEVRRARQDGACLIIAPSTEKHIRLHLGYSNRGAMGFPRRVFMRRIALVVRTVEAIKRGREIQINAQNIRALLAPGTCSFAPEWYLDPRTWEFYNGTLSHPEVPATSITVEEMKRIVLNACNDSWIRTWVATHFGDNVKLIPITQGSQ